MKLSHICFARWQIFLLLLIIVVSLLNIEYFFNSNSVAYYSTCAAILFYTIFNIFLNRHQQPVFRTPVILFILWCFYVLFCYLMNRASLVFTIYSIALCFLLLTSTFFFNSLKLRFIEFCIGVTVISTIEALYCFIQYSGFAKSQNIYFKVTGSWENPNVTAIFLALTVPFFLYVLKRKNKKIILAGFVILISALLMLKCRAAFIGTIVSIIVFYSLEYRLADWAKNKKNNLSVKAFLVLSLIISVSACSYLYNSKKDSADGRKFIWKLSSVMAMEKPLTGYGYGYFEKEYNLFQANYIKKGNATPEELVTAGPVIMPHNELLLHAVEGGFIGVLLISLFFGSLLFTIRRKNRDNPENSKDKITKVPENNFFNLGYAGTISFIAMSMVNSTTQIIPLMCLLMIYAAMICSTTEPVRVFKDISFFKTDKFSIILKAGTITVSSFLLYQVIILASADRQNKKAKLLKETGNYEQSWQILASLEPALKENSDYWQNYGHLYFKMKRFPEASACFEKAKKFSSLPPVYLGSGKIYHKLKQYPHAVQEYETLVALYPSKFLYRMLLLEMYLKNKNIPDAISLAEEIIRLKPKIQSEKVDRYKNHCRALLVKLSVHENIKKFRPNNKSITNSISK